MRYLSIFLFVTLSFYVSGQEVTERLNGFSPLIGKTWIAEGVWGNGQEFKQEISFSVELNGSMVVARSMGYVDEGQTQWGQRNHGIRKWDEKAGKITFVEYDVFGGVTRGTVGVKGNDIFYTYDYGGTQVTDAWIRQDDYSYRFKVGNFSDGEWKQVFLETEFRSLPLFSGPRDDLDALLAGMKAFSATYMKEDHIGISKFYTENGKIMPNGTPIIQGRTDIAQRWKLNDGVDVLHHAIHPVEVHIKGDTAYDYGYYEGSTKVGDKDPSHWKGKYVIIWKKVDGDWLIDVDIWNRVNE